MYNYNLSHNEKLRFGGERRKGRERDTNTITAANKIYNNSIL
jgi:hypothetical protein